LLINVFKLVITFKKCKIKPNIRYKDKTLVKDIFSYTIWITISSIASRLSLSIMPTLLAMVQNSSIVAVFGISIILETYAYLFSTAISGLFLPKVVKYTSTNDFESINKASISIGKFQMVLSGLILVGFIIFGKEFLTLYLEPMYLDAYLPTIFLFITVVFMASLIIPQTVSFALGTIKYVALIELVVSIIRLILCWVFAKYYGIIGLSLCFLIFDLLMNFLKLFFVYYKKQKLNLSRFCIKVYLKFLIPICISFIIGFLIKKTFYLNSWTHLIICCLSLAIIFILLSLLFYFDKNERNYLLNLFLTIIPFNKQLIGLFKKAKLKDHFVQSFVCFALIVISMFTSNYPITKIALVALLVFFANVLLFYIYFCLPIKCQNEKRIKVKNLIKNSSLWFVFFLTLGFFVTFFATKSFDSAFGYLKYLIIFWSAFLFVEIFSFETFIKAFKNIFFYLCCFSLFMTLIIAINGNNFSPIIHNGTYYNYYFIFFSMTRAPLLGKNCGIFWEPGIFASFCCIALAIQIMFDKNKWYKQLPYYVVFLLSLFSSGSLAGYFLLVLLFSLFVGSIKKKSTDILSWFLTIFIISIFVLCVPFYDVVAKVFPILSNKGLSLTTRVYSILVDLQIFKTNPIWGVGSQYSLMFNNISSTKYPGLLDTSLNTFGYYLATFGFSGLLFAISFVFSILFCNKINNREKIICLVLGILILSKEPHSLSLLTMIVFFYFMKDSNLYEKIVWFKNQHKSEPIHE